jgi:peptidoglycan/LPS O-acetylase OafA/YrhL
MIKYRADVDGLRAIAILFVLVYHGGLTLFPSGFIGVDIFFVISGFLITTIIHGSLENNQFSLMDFYNRRLWRLQPVLISLIIVTLILTLCLYLPEDLIQYSRSARVLTIPLLHTWSLSIEWQCYFILPILLYLLHRLVNQKKFNFTIYMLAVSSMCLSIYLSKTAPAAGYYQFTSRIFEFLIGSCVAVGNFSRFNIHRYLLMLLGGSALICLFYVASQHHILIGYPNFYTLLICLAAAILIAIGKINPKHQLTSYLSFRPLVFIGLLSYSLYIWHWIIFALVRYENINETNLMRGIAYLATFTLAYFSWRFIEKPTRVYNQMKFHYTFIVLVIFPILLTHVSSYLIKSHAGYPHRFNPSYIYQYDQLTQHEIPLRTVCMDENIVGINPRCILGATQVHSKKGLMIGDSFSNHFWGLMDVIAKSANVSITAQAIPACLALPDIQLYDHWFKNKHDIYHHCAEQTKRYFQMIKTNHYDYVILSQNWRSYLSDHVIHHLDDQRSVELAKKRIQLSLEKALAIINQSGAKPVLITAQVPLDKHKYDCILTYFKHHQVYHPGQCNFTWTASAAEDLWFAKLFHHLHELYPTLIIIDPKKVQCSKHQCQVDINGVPIYRDIAHITDYASVQLGNLYLQKYKNPLT